MNERTMNTSGLALPALMRATLFAAEKHRAARHDGQRAERSLARPSDGRSSTAA